MNTIVLALGRLLVCGVAILLLRTGGADAAVCTYVVNRRSDSISVIDTMTNAVVATIPVSGCTGNCMPVAIAIGPSHTVAYIANATGSVAVVDLVEGRVTTSIPVGEYLTGSIA